MAMTVAMTGTWYRTAVVRMPGRVMAVAVSVAVRGVGVAAHAKHL